VPPGLEQILEFAEEAVELGGLRESGNASL
jgi:hypothetical protein